MVTLQYGEIKIRHNIRHIKSYTSDTKVEEITPETFMTMSIYDYQLYISVLFIKYWTQGI